MAAPRRKTSAENAKKWYAVKYSKKRIWRESIKSEEMTIREAYDVYEEEISRRKFNEEEEEANRREMTISLNAIWPRREEESWNSKKPRHMALRSREGLHVEKQKKTLTERRYFTMWEKRLKENTVYNHEKMLWRRIFYERGEWRESICVFNEMLKRNVCLRNTREKLSGYSSPTCCLAGLREALWPEISEEKTHCMRWKLPSNLAVAHTLRNANENLPAMAAAARRHLLAATSRLACAHAAVAAAINLWRNHAKLKKRRLRLQNISLASGWNEEKMRNISQKYQANQLI